jgi:hypothetical protein
VSQGDGGGGGFLLAAPGGVWFSGHVRVGTGDGAVYGRLLNPFTFLEGPVGYHSYARWDAMPQFTLTAGAGGGGSGGGGQTLPTPPDAAVVVAQTSTPNDSRVVGSTTAGHFSSAGVRIGSDRSQLGEPEIGNRVSTSSTSAAPFSASQTAPAVQSLHGDVFADAMMLAAELETLA